MMKKIISILIFVFIVFIIIFRYQDKDNFKDQKNTFRVEKGKVEMTLPFFVD